MLISGLKLSPRSLAQGSYPSIISNASPDSTSHSLYSSTSE